MIDRKTGDEQLDLKPEVERLKAAIEQVNNSFSEKLTNSDAARKEIKDLEAQVEELLLKILELQKTVIDWHSAMFGALCLILKPHRFNLTMEREHLLNLMPTRIDCLIAKKNQDIEIDMDVFRSFLKYNVIELKSYQDSLDEKVIWKTISYASSFISLEEDVSADEVTITIIRSAFPRQLMRDLKEHGWKIDEPYKNIFYLSGKVDIPIQLVVAKDLGDEYIPLQILTGNAKESDVRKVMEEREKTTNLQELSYLDAVLWASSEANEELFRKLKEDERMHGVLREIMKDDFEQVSRDAANQAVMRERNTVAERLINKGYTGSAIADATGYDRSQINSIAQRLNRTVTWGEARA